MSKSDILGSPTGHGTHSRRIVTLSRSTCQSDSEPVAAALGTCWSRTDFHLNHSLLSYSLAINRQSELHHAQDSHQAEHIVSPAPATWSLTTRIHNHGRSATPEPTHVRLQTISTPAMHPFC